jgi:hypothetical protein
MIVANTLRYATTRNAMRYLLESFALLITNVINITSHDSNNAIG